MSKFHHILLVSTSNTGRGCMAEAILREQLKKENIEDVEVYSRGLVVLFPEPMNPKAGVVLENNNIPVETEYTSKQLTQQDVEWSDLVLVMSQDQKEKVMDEYKNVPEIYTIKEVGREQGEVLDPYGKDMIDYEYCYRELERLVEKLMTEITGEIE